MSKKGAAPELAKPPSKATPEDIAAVAKDSGISVQAISSLASTKFKFHLVLDGDQKNRFDFLRTLFVRSGPTFTDERRFQSAVMDYIIAPLLAEFFDEFTMPVLKFSDNVAPDCPIVKGGVLHFILESKASPTETGKKPGQTQKKDLEELTKQITQLIEYIMKSLASDKYEFAQSVTGIVLNVETLTLIDLALNGKKFKSVKAIKVGLPKGDNKKKYDQLLCLFSSLLDALNTGSRDEDGHLVVADLPLEDIPFDEAAPQLLASKKDTPKKRTRRASTVAEGPAPKKHKKDEKEKEH